MKGGYKIIDFKSIPLSDADHPVLVPDLRAVLDNNYNKAVLLTNVILGSTPMDDCFSTVVLKDNGRIKLNSYDGYITVDSNSYAHYTEGGSGDPTAEIEEIKEDISDIQTDIGDLSDLETSDQTSIVNAINEVNTGVSSLNQALSNTQQMIAPIESNSSSASQGYAIGEQFILNGLLCEATSAIAQGASLVLNGNYKLADSVTEQINKLFKTVTVTATTDINSVIVPDVSGNNFIISAFGNDGTNSIICLPYRTSAGSWRIKCLDYTNMAHIPNTSVNATIVYI